MSTLPWIESGFLWYFTSINVFYTLFLILGAIQVLRRIREVRREDTLPILTSESLPQIVFAVPMFNERENIVPNLYNLIHLNYRYKQIIAVNDGSEDGTLEAIQKEFELIAVPKFYPDLISTQPVRQVYQSKKHPELIVIDKERGRKFDAINAALNASTHPIVVVLDADTFLDNQSITALIRPLLAAPETIAIGANVRLINGCTLLFDRVATTDFPQEILPAFQGLEYLRSFLLRQGLNVVNSNLIVAGAFSVFPRSLLLEVGGFGPSVGEDVEIIVRLHRIMREKKRPYKITYLPDPVAWTVAPMQWSQLGQQRSRWHLGLLESLWFHRRMFANRHYGIFGLFSFPFWVISEVFEPLVEFSAWLYVLVAWSLGSLNIDFLLLLASITLIFTGLSTLFCLLIEEFGFRKYSSLKNLAALLISNALENIGYRQLSVFWRIRGFYWFWKKRDEIRKNEKVVHQLVTHTQLSPSPEAIRSSIPE